MILDNVDPLKQKMYDALSTVVISMVAGDAEGNLTYPLLPNLDENTSAKTCKFTSSVSQPENTEPYNNDSTDGLRKIIEIVVKETADYYIKNAEIAAKSRYDALENDYNNLVLAIQAQATALTTTGATPVLGSALGALLTLIATAGGAAPVIGRTPKTELSKLENEIDSQGNTIQIK